MPMCDAHIPDGALSPSAKRALLRRVTDLLLERKGTDSQTPRHLRVRVRQRGS